MGEYREERMQWDLGSEWRSICGDGGEEQKDKMDGACTESWRKNDEELPREGDLFGGVNCSGKMSFGVISESLGLKKA